jgi:hypothetical protein
MHGTGRIRGWWVGCCALFTAACSTGQAPLGPATVGTTSTKLVTFTVQIDPSAFSDKGPIKVSIWDETQLQTLEVTSPCTVSYDVQSGKETVSCPAGITYRQAVPEEVTVTKADLAKGVTVPSQTVTVGERYRIAVSGKAADDCNTASASKEGKADSESIPVANVQVAQTMMACVGATQAR